MMCSGHWPSGVGSNRKNVNWITKTTTLGLAKRSSLVTTTLLLLDGYWASDASISTMEETRNRSATAGPGSPSPGKQQLVLNFIVANPVSTSLRSNNNSVTQLTVRDALLSISLFSLPLSHCHICSSCEQHMCFRDHSHSRQSRFFSPLKPR